MGASDCNFKIIRSFVFEFVQTCRASFHFVSFFALPNLRQCTLECSLRVSEWDGDGLANVLCDLK